MPLIPEQGLPDDWLLETHPELLVLNKPAGLSLLRDRSGAIDLWQRLGERYGKLYLVHRLDKATSGVLLVARNQALQSALTRRFAERSLTKTYLADVYGDLELTGTGCIDLPLRKGRKSRYRIAAPRAAIRRRADRWAIDDVDALQPDRVEAVTYLRCLANKPAGQTRLLLRPLTGRTHQLRVHLAWIGHGIIGDPLYGQRASAQEASDRMWLHAAGLNIPGIGRWRAALVPAASDVD